MRLLARELCFHWPFLLAALMLNLSEMPVFGQWCVIRCSDGSVGSGTLVDTNGDRSLVITAHHVVRDVMRGQQRTGRVICDFPGEPTRYAAEIVSIAPQADLCALLIDAPRQTNPVPLARYDRQKPISIYGFPGGGPLSVRTGRVVDDTSFSRAPGVPMVSISCPSEGGQSGCAAVSDEGMIGVMWGCENGHAALTAGKPFDDFMVSLTQGYSCYGGKCWRSSPSYSPGSVVVTPTQPRPQPKPQPASYTDPQWVEWRKQIEDSIESARCKCGDQDYATKSDITAAIAAIKFPDQQTIDVDELASTITNSLSHKFEERFVSIEETLNQQPEPPAEQAEPQIVSYDIVPRQK